MATFRTGQQTHPGVLPQRRALELGSADIPGIRDETGPEHHRRVASGAEHVRGEAGPASPGGPGVTPDPGGVGEQGRKVHTKQSEPYVFVLDKNKTPLQSCPPARARKLLDKGRVVVHRHTPFTVRLKDRTVEEFVTDPATLARILARAKAPLRHAAAVQSTRWALWRELDERLPTHVASGGRTKWNRTCHHLPKSHTLDALAGGKVEAITQTVPRVLVAGCSGRGCYAHTRPDEYGFPRLRLPRAKGFFGFATGDLVRAVVAKGKWAGAHTGRVAVRSSGSHTVTAPAGAVKTSYKNLRLLQRADGYAYTTQKEAGVSSSA